MPKHEGVSLSVIRRLPRYYRFLGDLLKKDVTRISSRELAQLMQLTASQIRQDLNCFGGFGQQGYGYNVAALYKEIGNILGLNKQADIILIGAGNLGRTLAKHMNFDTSGFKLVGIFDNSPTVIGQKIREHTVRDTTELEDFCRENHPRAAILCIPREVAYETAERLKNLGINCFWNFSHYDLLLNFENVVVENVHLGDSLMTLCYRMNQFYADEKS
ncbi:MULTISPECIES: redox-sensing transcriptional repressor Rex [Anaerotruncus]|uniref:redox-sensing transcriptional repressor Rex n=1 Tax=Anaerotruncus TaxID=244127 RepID=UPI0008314B4D|nr:MULTISPECIES: redox-sensing transcriptional repressor Rex [Anaerotruncus]RGX54476.1 redox-sensing transcriptional repressor Rex [Anaerotruncus sp. AF02-27]